MTNCFFDIKIDNQDVGRITFKLYDEVVPKTTKNFIELCQNEKPNGYKNSLFHRIIPGFMAQGGDFTNENGTGGKSIYGTKFNDENFIKKHKKHVLSMANAGPNTNGSQFFITFCPTPHLDGHHVVFGEVISGSEVLDQMEQFGSNSGKTRKRVVISNCGVSN